MSIIINKNTKILVQGLTGKEGKIIVVHGPGGAGKSSLLAREAKRNNHLRAYLFEIFFLKHISIIIDLSERIVILNVQIELFLENTLKSAQQRTASGQIKRFSRDDIA